LREAPRDGCCAALRTRNDVKPVCVSAGHRIDLPAAVLLVLDRAVRYRPPEPVRLADALVATVKRSMTTSPIPHNAPSRQS